jgi:hypothetical protein
MFWNMEWGYRLNMILQRRKQLGLLLVVLIVAATSYFAPDFDRKTALILRQDRDEGRRTNSSNRSYLSMM